MNDQPVENSGRFAIVPDALLDPACPATPREIAVYAVLANHANRDGECWPSIARISDCLGISKPTVHKALDALETIGAISRVARYRDDGAQTSSLYEVHTYGINSPGKENKGGGVKPINTPSKESLDRIRTNEQEPMNIDSRPADGGPDDMPTGDVQGALLGEDSPATISADAMYESEFETWWRDYPKKESKKDARRAYVKARRRHEAAVIAEGLARYVAYLPSAPWRKPMVASRFLNQEEYLSPWTPEQSPERYTRGQVAVVADIARLQAERAATGSMPVDDFRRLQGMPAGVERQVGR